MSMVNISDVLELIDELYGDVQNMREYGDSDLRTVLHWIEQLERQVKKLDK